MLRRRCRCALSRGRRCVLQRWRCVLRRRWGRCTQALHLARLPLLQKLGLLPMLVLDRGLLLRVGTLLIQVGVITLLHLVEGIALLLVSRLQRGLLVLVVRFRVRGRLRRARRRVWRACRRLWRACRCLRFGQIPCMHGHRTARATRSDRV